MIMNRMIIHYFIIIQNLETHSLLVTIFKSSFSYLNLKIFHYFITIQNLKIHSLIVTLFKLGFSNLNLNVITGQPANFITSLKLIKTISIQFLFCFYPLLKFISYLITHFKNISKFKCVFMKIYKCVLNLLLPKIMC